METNKIILLVEDNPDDEILTLDALHASKLANEIVVTRNGADAIDYMFGEGQFSHREVTDTPAVVLLDLKLPKIDGLEVLRRIRTDDRTKFTPVVILTSSREEEDMVKGYQLGANSYVRKPVDFQHFVESVGNLGVYWLLINEKPNIV